MQRQKARLKYQVLGYIDYEETVGLLSIHSELLWTAGMFEYKDSPSTAELYEFRPSGVGNKFFRHFLGDQLIMLRPEMIREFLLATRGNSNKSLS